MTCATVGCPYLACVLIVWQWTPTMPDAAFYPTCAPCWLRWALAERT